MKKFLAVLYQPGNGCDSEFSIGCGVRTLRIEAETDKDAFQQLKDTILTDFSGEYKRLEFVYLYELNSSYEIDVALWYSQLDNQKVEEAKIAIQQQELQEYNRIKQKYNL